MTSYILSSCKSHPFTTVYKCDWETKQFYSLTDIFASVITQGEHKVFPWLQTFITRTVRCTSVRRVSTVDNFPTRWCTSTLGFTRSLVFGCSISKQVDWERWFDTLATTITRYHPPLTSFYGGMLRIKCFRHQFQILQNLKARITDAFATITEDMLGNKWRDWLSIRRSPCNKRSTCSSVLMCCKKKLLELHFEKKCVCIPHTVVFL